MLVCRYREPSQRDQVLRPQTLSQVPSHIQLLLPVGSPRRWSPTRQLSQGPLVRAPGLAKSFASRGGVWQCCAPDTSTGLLNGMPVLPPPPPLHKNQAFNDVRSTMVGRAAVPPDLWRAYRKEMITAYPDQGPRTVAYEQGQIRSGELRVRLLGDDVSAPLGFLLHTASRAGVQAETLYLARGNRSENQVRALLDDLCTRGPLFSFRGTVLGVAPSLLKNVMPGLGFRCIQRQRLWIDPRRPRASATDPLRVRIRRLRRSDEAAIERLCLAAYARHIDSAFGSGADVKVWGRAYVRGLFRPGKYPIDYRASFVAEGERALVGDVLVLRGAGLPHVQDLSVHPGYRRRGVGTALLRHALAAVAKQGARRAEITVTIQNPTGALNLYRRLGFRPDRSSRRDHGLWVHEATRRKLRLAVLEA